jgi:ADP-ribosylglycohydrolase
MRVRIAATCAFLALVSAAYAQAPGPRVRRLPLKEYRDRMMAGWIGQIAGVSFGAPTEGRWSGKIMPEESTPKWSEDLLNDAFGQDDLYVEMTFLRTLETYGLDVSARQAGIDFANSEYGVWCANRAGRENLRRGIAPPDSGHPRFSRNSDDIDYQIEADYSGLIAPGLPNTVIALGDKFGRMMNYGDGLYAGQFMGGMYAEAFFQSDILKVIDAGLKCIPAESQYAGMVRDLCQWYRDNPDSWEKSWALVDERYSRDSAYHRYASGGIDAKLNGACVLLGLLYGKGDPEHTMAIACRAGWDSDCNPSSAAGVLFTTIGYDRLPDRFKAKLRQDATFAYTGYTFPQVVDVCEKLARQTVVQAGGRIEKDAQGAEVFVIPIVPPKPGPVERSWEAGPVANSRFTEEEMKQIRFPDQLTLALKTVAPGWTLTNCGQDMGAPALLGEFAGKKNVLITHPLDQATADVLTRQVEIPAGKKTVLKLTVGHFPQGDWLLQVKADGAVLTEKTVGKDTAPDGWLDVAVDLSAYAGKTVTLELVNQPTGWAWEAAYWAEIALEST